MANYVQLDQVYVGDTQQVDVAITDDSGAAVDITGWSIEYTVKTSKETATELYNVTETVFDDPTNGTTTIYVLDTVTQNWTTRANVYDIVVGDLTGSTHIFTTYQIGSFNVVQPVHNVP